MSAFSLDLRRRILAAALADDAPHETTVAGRFGVSRSFVHKLKHGWRTHATAEPVGHRGGAPPKLSHDDHPYARADQLRRGGRGSARTL